DLPHAASSRRPQAVTRFLLLGGRRRRRAGPRHRHRGPCRAEAEMSDFWLTCGHHFLDRDDTGGYVVTDEFLKIYLARPELIPPPEACAAEQSLHRGLLMKPRRAVANSDIAAIADADARENWQLLVEFRDHLLKHKTLEAGYLDLIRSSVGKTPPLFIN